MFYVFQIAKLRIMFRTEHTANTAELTNIAFIQPDMVSLNGKELVS